MIHAVILVLLVLVIGIPTIRAILLAPAYDGAPSSPVVGPDAPGTPDVPRPGGLGD